jgi:hypothetical protein
MEVCTYFFNKSDRFDLIVPTNYVMRNSAFNFNKPHTLGLNKNLKVIFGITELDFHQSSASLSFSIVNVGTQV